MRLLPVLLIAIAALLFAAPGHDNTAEAVTNCDVTDYSLDTEEQELFQLINDYRARNGRAALSLHDDLNRTATWMSTDLGTNNYFSHTDSLGRSAYTRAVQCGYSTGAGENLAAGKGWDRARDAFNGWRRSSSHNSNMLSGLWQDIGVARVHVPESRYGWYWTIELGAGEPAAPADAEASSPTAPATASPTSTSTPVPTSTATPTNTPTPTPTVTSSPTPTSTPVTVSQTTSCDVDDYSLDAEELRLLDLINDYRAQNGRGLLSLHDDLNRTATWKSTDLGTSGSFSHTDSLGRSAYTRAIQCGYSTGAGENLAAGSSWDTAREAFDAWRRSTGHNSNMLSTLWRDIGIARVYVPGSRYGWYWTIELGAGEPAGGTQ